MLQSKVVHDVACTISVQTGSTWFAATIDSPLDMKESVYNFYKHVSAYSIRLYDSLIPFASAQKQRNLLHILQDPLAYVLLEIWSRSYLF